MKENTIPVKTERRRVPSTHESDKTLKPVVDIFETAEGLTVIADLPGVKKEDVQIQIENDILTIKATPKSKLTLEPTYREFELYPYFRQFQLSDKVDQDKIKAEMKNGVLVIQLPKREDAKPKQISVTVS
ncbi:MAG TPA: Hsp20/alpha crystallin family protein [Candidatus Hydrogenedens sp.]|nr:Hsp20/alpha crystallin family protein [Candidatus Hydrogenedens sp.]